MYAAEGGEGEASKRLLSQHSSRNPRYFPANFALSFVWTRFFPGVLPTVNA